MSKVAMHRKIAFAGVGEANLSATAVRSALERTPAQAFANGFRKSTTKEEQAIARKPARKHAA
jgi:hypothetical protein